MRSYSGGSHIFCAFEALGEKQKQVYMFMYTSPCILKTCKPWITHRETLNQQRHFSNWNASSDLSTNFPPSRSPFSPKFWPPHPWVCLDSLLEVNSCRLCLDSLPRSILYRLCMFFNWYIVQDVSLNVDKDYIHVYIYVHINHNIHTHVGANPAATTQTSNI